MAADANHLSIGGGYVQKLKVVTFTKRLLDLVVEKYLYMLNMNMS